MPSLPLYAVVMAGGSGTRFWPASRTSRPKQLLPLTHDASSLLAATVRRLHPLIGPERVLVVTAAALADATRAEVPALPAANVLCEPSPRNTAPCIGWATREVLTRAKGEGHDDALVAVLPSDHHVAREDAFRDTLARAVEAAKVRAVSTIGIRPTRPDTGYGYIELATAIDGVADAYDVARFVEKPDLERARAFVESGQFLWNSGMFFFRAREMDAAIARHLPELSQGLDAMFRGGASPSQATLDATFPTLPSISIDYGVVEKIAKTAQSIAVVPGDFGWSDVGSWESAWELAGKDDAQNALPNDGSLAIDARGNLARVTPGKVVALLGVHDLVVVETDDAILVMPRARAQDVRAVVDALKATGKKHLT